MLTPEKFIALIKEIKNGGARTLVRVRLIDVVLLLYDIYQNPNPPVYKGLPKNEVLEHLKTLKQITEEDSLDREIKSLLSLRLSPIPSQTYNTDAVYSALKDFVDAYHLYFLSQQKEKIERVFEREPENKDINPWSNN